MKDENSFFSYKVLCCPLKLKRQSVRYLIFLMTLFFNYGNYSLMINFGRASVSLYVLVFRIGQRSSKLEIKRVFALKNFSI